MTTTTSDHLMSRCQVVSKVNPIYWSIKLFHCIRFLWMTMIIPGISQNLTCYQGNRVMASGKPLRCWDNLWPQCHPLTACWALSLTCKYSISHWHPLYILTLDAIFLVWIRKQINVTFVPEQVKGMFTCPKDKQVLQVNIKPLHSGHIKVTETGT